MFRVSLLFCVSLIFGIMAKPHKPWNKLTDEAFQGTLMSVDTTGKISPGEEVEPPEDMDETGYDIDPSMKIWKHMVDTRQHQQYVKAEVDLDEMHHPSMADLEFQAADTQWEPEPGEAAYSPMTEEGKDDIDHPDFSNVAFEEPEQVWDETKARAKLDRYLSLLTAEYRSEVRAEQPEAEREDEPLSSEQTAPLRPEVEVQPQSEDDMDVLYHADPRRSNYYRIDAEEAAAVRQHSEPEEDVDDLYHQ